MTLSCLELDQNGPQMSTEVKRDGRIVVSDIKLRWTNLSSCYYIHHLILILQPQQLLHALPITCYLRQWTCPASNYVQKPA